MSLCVLSLTLCACVSRRVLACPSVCLFCLFLTLPICPLCLCVLCVCLIVSLTMPVRLSGIFAFFSQFLCVPDSVCLYVFFSLSLTMPVCSRGCLLISLTMPVFWTSVCLSLFCLRVFVCLNMCVCSCFSYLSLTIPLCLSGCGFLLVSLSLCLSACLCVWLCVCNFGNFGFRFFVTWLTYLRF